jgi:Mn-dependent DtxR family transcriptional regulator
MLVRIIEAEQRRELVARFYEIGAKTYMIAEILGFETKFIESDVIQLKNDGRIERRPHDISKATKRWYYKQIEGKVLKRNLIGKIFIKYQMKYNKRISANKMAKKTGFSQQSCLKYLRNLEKRGYLKRDWSATIKGKRRFGRDRSFVDGLENIRSFLIGLIKKRIGD